MIRLSDQDSDRLSSRIKEISGISVESPIEILTDTSHYSDIYRGHVIQLDDVKLLVSGDVYEFRFGLEGMPKYWVKRGYDLSTGQRVIIKFEFHEELVTALGSFNISCYRDPKKEGNVLSLVKGDSRFMQGRSYLDESGNNVRVMEWINGKTLYQEILDMEIGHEQYYYTCLYSVLKKAISCFEAIGLLNDNFLCHGDIRSDHILIDEETGEFRWIDFDLNQNFEGYDVWFLGRVVQFIIGKGFNSLHEICSSGMFPAYMLSNLKRTDSSVFYPKRLMNLRKIYPYIDKDLNDILMHFSVGADKQYSLVSELVRDLNQILPAIPRDSSDKTCLPVVAV